MITGAASGIGQALALEKPIGGIRPFSFANTRNAVLGRAKDGEGRASAVEPIFSRHV